MTPRQLTMFSSDEETKIAVPARQNDSFVAEQVQAGRWRSETLAPELTGLTRPIRVYRAARKSAPIKYAWHGDRQTFCPPQWWDLGIGSGACGLGCRACFLMLTFRAMRDPLAHVLYDNYQDFTMAVKRWLSHPDRRPQHTLGVGIDCSDSLLYEGVTRHVRTLAPMFANPRYNPQHNRLVLLTKSSNTHYLADIAPKNRHTTIVTFSLNPAPVASLWEGRWPDTGEAIPPTIGGRLVAAALAQQLGFEVRVRLDPIMTPDGWQDHYRDFVKQVKQMGLGFRYWTLGTYREKNPMLDLWRDRWGLPAMEWQPQDEDLAQDGTHRHLPEARRVEIYRTVQGLIRQEFPKAKISLCKETHRVRRQVAGMCNADCNCLV